ncbi:ThuA domain-containing protein [Marinivivus vitaminiproducens]|uniref:ThuA domain-containing protein n=1 Tax=Marinivivus vitaminiproducens TaxID=3035935 RepID=UPI0027998946|nr:ThuA domain-containing protein [Geminicoccaceae bacterium SCSIO 64248]
MSAAPRILIWNEFWHERNNPVVGRIYPDGIHTALADALGTHGFEDIRTATLDQPEHGLTEEALESTDVLLWWGHKKHGEVSDAVAERVQARVLAGMGLVVLHSGHFSKPFKRLTGTACTVNWREDGERERIWVIAPEHPIAAGLDRYFELEKEEMYGEPFEVPAPDELVFLSWFKGGEVFRSGCCYTRGRGRIFYFRPGHETFPTYHDATVQKVIANGIRWAAPTLQIRERPANVNRRPIEAID